MFNRHLNIALLRTKWLTHHHNNNWILTETIIPLTIREILLTWRRMAPVLETNSTMKSTKLRGTMLWGTKITEIIILTTTGTKQIPCSAAPPCKSHRQCWVWAAACLRHWWLQPLKPCHSTNYKTTSRTATQQPETSTTRKLAQATQWEVAMVELEAGATTIITDKISSNSLSLTVFNIEMWCDIIFDE